MVWICNCNPFDSNTVHKDLACHKDKRVTVAGVYKSCSGGLSPDCNQCIPALAALVKTHNADVTIGELKHNLPDSAPAKVPA